MRVTYNIWTMRVLGIDVGRKRIGLAISDPSGTLARPLQTLTVDAGAGVAAVVRELQRLANDEEGLSAVVVGLPVVARRQRQRFRSRSSFNPLSTDCGPRPPFPFIARTSG